MKKTWKRLCTGFLALATVVTALPTTPVHAESKPDTLYYLCNVFTYQFSSFHDTQSRKSGKAGNREGV